MAHDTDFLDDANTLLSKLKIFSTNTPGCKLFYPKTESMILNELKDLLSSSCQSLTLSEVNLYDRICKKLIPKEKVGPVKDNIGDYGILPQRYLNVISMVNGAYMFKQS